MDRNPFVTLIIPTKNCSTSIKEVLYAVNNQEYRDFETIVVDSSEDDTAEIASSFAVKIVKCELNGLTIARNMGIKNSQGKIICFTDGDCTMDKNWLSRIVSEFSKSDQIACVGGSVLVNDASLMGKYYSEAFVPIYPIYSKHSLINKSNFFEQPFGGTRFPAGCNLAFQKEALTMVGGFNDKWTNAWDEFEVLKRLVERGYLISISPEIIVYHAPRRSFIEAARQTYSYGFGAGRFAMTYQNGHLKNRVRLTFSAAFKTFFHSVNIFRKSGAYLAFTYPFIDMLLGISYYCGFVNAYIKGKFSNVSFDK